MDYIAVMVPESSMTTAGAIVSEVEAQLSEARLSIRENGAFDDPVATPC
jgi:hypothetical protein